MAERHVGEATSDCEITEVAAPEDVDREVTLEAQVKTVRLELDYGASLLHPSWA